MLLKLLFVIGLFLLYFVMRDKGKEKEYFYLTIIMFVMREMNMPIFGSITPSTVMIFAIFIGSFSKISIYLRRHGMYIITLLFAVTIGLLNTNFNFARVAEWALLLSSIVVISSICQYYIQTEEDLRTLTKCIVVVCFIFSITTIMAYYGMADGTVIYSGVDPSNTDNYHASRIYGITFSNLVQAISVISICLLPTLNSKKKGVEYLLIIVFVYAALITLKRMTFIAMVIALLYYLRRQVEIRNFKVVLIVTALCVTFIYLWWEPLIYRFGIAGFGTGVVTDHSTQTRIDRIDYAIDAFKQSPILGMGAGYVIYIHNGFFEILANCGIIGICTVFLKLIPRFKDILQKNSYAISSFIYLITCVSLEAAISKAQTIYFLGLFLGGYYASKDIELLNDYQQEDYGEK